MKNYIKKVSKAILIVLLLSSSVFANQIAKYVNQSGLDIKSTVSIFVEGEKDGKILYKKNEQKLLNPASILKVLTFGASYIVLGENYKFETSLYKDKNNDLYVKLGGDTLLSENDLTSLFAQFKKKYPNFKIKNIYIDDSVIEASTYPSGWMEDDIWPNERAITPYIVNHNLTEIAIKRSSLAKKVDIIQNDDYKLPVVNELKISDNNSNIQKINFERLYGEDSSIVNIRGEVSKDELIKLPVLKPEINFNIKLQNALKKNDIRYKKQIVSKKINSNADKLLSISHSIEDVSKDILLNSDNFAAEVVFKVAAAKYINYSHPATLEDSILMFNEIYQPFFTDGIKIVDGSGVSRYNLVSADFIVNSFKFLSEKTNIKRLLATASVGTLSERLLFLKDNLRAKTGTLSKMSSIAGMLTTQKGNDVIFAIIIQNSPKRKAVLKNIENSIIGIIYKEY